MGQSRMDKKKNWQHWIHKKQHEEKQNNIKYVGLHYTQTNINNVNKT